MAVSLEGMSAEDIQGLARLQLATLSNPETRTDALRLAKKVDPTANYPELALEDRLAKHREEVNAELARRDKEAAESNARAVRARALENARAQLGDDAVKVVDEKTGVTAVEQFMIENKIGDYDAGVRLYKTAMQPAAVSNSSFQPGSTIPGPPTLPQITLGEHTNIDQWARNEGINMLNDVRSGKVKVNESGVVIP